MKQKNIIKNTIKKKFIFRKSKKNEFNAINKVDLSTHTIEQLLEKIPPIIRPTIDEYLIIYYIIEKNEVILNSMNVIDKINYLEYGGRIY